MNEQPQTAAKATPLTTAQKIAALEEKKRKLIEKSRKEETKKKIVFGAAIAAMLAQLLNLNAKAANDMIKITTDLHVVAEKDKPIFDAMIADIREKAAKKKVQTQAQTHAQAG